MIRNILLNILIWFYQFNIFNFYTLKLISLIGGPVFIKIFQVFHNLNSLNYFHNEGTIGTITFTRDLVVKKLRPNIYNNFVNSLNIFKSFIIFNNYKFPFDYNDFSKYNLLQLDMNIEAENAKKLENVFENIYNVSVIKIYRSNKKYHISKKIVGFDIDLLLAIHPHCQKKLIYLLHLSYLLMLIKNCFHCDWHFGNFLIRLDSKKNLELNILDTGLVGTFDKKIHDRIKSLLLTDFLFPKRYNVIKFLLFCNTNQNANIKNFIDDTKLSFDNYNTDIRNIINKAGVYNLKFPIMVLYMFQGILFINKLCLSSNVSINELKKYAKEKNFYNEIKNSLK